MRGHANEIFLGKPPADIHAPADDAGVAARGVHEDAVEAAFLERRTRLHAIWTLDGLNAMEPALATKLLKDSDPFVRASAVRLLEGRLAAGDDAVIQQVVALAKDPQATVRRQVAASLGDVLEATEVPAANEVQCGWGANHTLEGAQQAAREFLGRRDEWRQVFA